MEAEKRAEYENWLKAQEAEAYEYDCSVKYEETQQKAQMLQAEQQRMGKNRHGLRFWKLF